VLDAGSVRGPVGRAFAFGVFTGAVALAAPLAALTLAPAEAIDTSEPYYVAAETPVQSPASALGSGIAKVVAPLASQVTKAGAATVATVATVATSAVHPHPQADVGEDVVSVAPSGATVEKRNGHTVMTSPSGATISVYPPDSRGLQKVVMTSPNGAVTTYSDARSVPGLNLPNSISRPRPRDRTVDNVVAIKAVGVTPEYVAAMRAASPALRHLEAGDMVGLKATGVTPAYVREIGAYARIEADELAGARAVGVTGDYVRSLAAAGFRGFSLDELIQMRAVGVTAADLAAYKRSGDRFSVDRVVDRKVDRHDRDHDEDHDADPDG
jgi:hypothetical protein